ncbi:hypothetical protein AcW1_007884 [Taiwanofungus camphoratus]|nr:hypothetical protein AcW2_007058 [Antrodia cinnamomea]KAI0953738.1 hypothetical protein AcW1_007884 [Antrodia cinnamomea]
MRRALVPLPPLFPRFCASLRSFLLLVQPFPFPFPFPSPLPIPTLASLSAHPTVPRRPRFSITHREHACASPSGSALPPPSLATGPPPIPIPAVIPSTPPFGRPNVLNFGDLPHNTDRKRSYSVGQWDRASKNAWDLICLACFSPPNGFGGVGAPPRF